MIKSSILTVLAGIVAVVVVLLGSTAGCDSSSGSTLCEGTTTCGDYGSCDDSSGSPICSCDQGYTGEHCEVCDEGYGNYGGGECFPIEPCGDDTVCVDAQRECVNDAGLAVCGECLDGFVDYGDGDCLDADPCATNTACDDLNRECINDLGTADCGPCLADLVDYGTGDCRDADPCAADTVCTAELRECVNDLGTVVCGDCVDGYMDDGGVCVIACGPVRFPGALVPFDLYLMVDKSASMTDGGKWGHMVTAVTNFVASADASGVGVGMQFFPLPPPPGAIYMGTCSSDAQCGIYGPCLMGVNVCAGSMAPDTSCELMDYSAPAVPIATLPSAATALQSSVGAATPDGSATPTQPAIQGAIGYATDWAQQHPDHRTYMVFITDGEPTGCSFNNSIDNAAIFIQGAANSSPSVGTFVVGIGSELSVLNQLAQAGGTQQAYLIGANPSQEFADAFADIRAHGYCHYQIPTPVVSGGDYGLVGVDLVDTSNPSISTTIAPVADAASCDPATGGWYYDDPVTPTEILLCPVSCDDFKAGGVDVDVILNCP